jgi:hypothetical protein
MGGEGKMSNAFATPYKRVMAALRGDCPDKVPFTVYENKISQSSYERELRNRGLCIVYRTTSYKISYPNVGIQEHRFTDKDGRYLIKTVYSTPFGELSEIREPAGFTSWQHEHIFKSSDDYRAILFMAEDAVVEPQYGPASRLAAEKGEDFVIRDQIPSEPLQSIILKYMGTETFCYEWMDNQDEIIKLYNALVETNRKVYKVVADGPLEFANYGGNVVPQLIGVENFKKFYIPNYNEAAEVLHKKGKLIGCHFDADNTLIMDAIGTSSLDYIEAFDPGMGPSVKEARKAWPDKVLWINWPSSSQLLTSDEIRELTVRIIDEAAPCKGFIIGITEDIPQEYCIRNYTAIMDGIDDYCKNS